MYKIFILSFLLITSYSKKNKNIGTIERLDPSLDSIISSGALPEIIADGFTWTEGPLWVEDKKMLLFSDVFANKVYKWKEGEKPSVFLSPSGYTGSPARGGELGSNALMLDNKGRLVLCQHGNRQVAIMDASLNNPKPGYSALANQYKGKKLNSPNDGTFNDAGDLYFTDPPYGLEGKTEDPSKEISFQGVYKVKSSGEVVLLCDSISRPNGIGLFPGGNKLLVANSDSTKPVWYTFDVVGDSIKNGRIFYDISRFISSGKGLPDGLKIDNRGNVFATGPAGVYIFNKNGKLLGRIKLPVAPSNCAFSADQKTLYITATNFVLRFRMRR